MNDPIDMVFAALANPTRRELLRLLRDQGRRPIPTPGEPLHHAATEHLRASESTPRCRVS